MHPHLLASSRGEGWVFLTYRGDPGSLNDNRNKRGRHWSKDREHKLEWEGVFLTGFMKERLPKPLVKVKVWVLFQFDRPGVRRDPENYRHPFAKPFADSLVKAGYIPDDTEDYFEIRRIAISDQKLKMTPVQQAMGLHSVTHVAVLYRLPPDALERQRAGGTQLQASSGFGGAAGGPGARG